MIHHPFMNWPIPDMKKLRERKAEYRGVRISPSSEPLVEINHGLKCHSYYWHYKPRPEGAMEKIFIRETVAAALHKMDQELRAYGLRLLIHEGYRPLSVQRFVQEHSVLKGLRKENPSYTESQLREMSKQFAASADADITIAPPPHLTGGAVDLLLITIDGEPVPMGKEFGLYRSAFPDALEAPEFAGHPAIKYRRLLYWLARQNGFATNPTELWHNCNGDQMWAWVTKASYAFYGAVEL